MAAAHLRGKSITLEKILGTNDPSTRGVKVICTIGPSCWDVPTLIEMIKAGMNVARLNFSHGDHATHLKTLVNLREAAEECEGCNLAIMLDTKGPEIRTGELAAASGKQEYVKGSAVFLTTDYTAKGDASLIACSYKSLPTTVKPGDTVLVADGSLMLQVTEVQEGGVMTQALNTATIGNRKNMNLPGAVVDLPTVTEKDKIDLVEFGVRNSVDMVAASFVRRGADIDNLREVLGPDGASIKIIAKIENQEGLHNFAEIAEKADGIMVARGDLGMELPSEKVFLAQKHMIRTCNLLGKPVITATQMLESMIVNPRPTRAECTDVANAVLDGTDCVMLSGETAGGAFPVRAVRTMAGICVEAESVTNHHNLYHGVLGSTRDEMGEGTVSVAESVASSAVKTAVDLNAKVIIVCSQTGNTARLVAKYRPEARILVLTDTDVVARQASGLLRGVSALSIGSMIGTEGILSSAIEQIVDFGWSDSGDVVVAIHGMLEGRPGSTNLMKVLVVP